MKTQDAPFCRVCHIWHTVNSSGLCARCLEAVEPQQAAILGVEWGKPGRFSPLPGSAFPAYAVVIAPGNLFGGATQALQWEGFKWGLAWFDVMDSIGIVGDSRYRRNIDLAKLWPNRMAGDFGKRLHEAPKELERHSWHAREINSYFLINSHKFYPALRLAPIANEGSLSNSRVSVVMESLAAELTPDIGN